MLALFLELFSTHSYMAAVQNAPIDFAIITLAKTQSTQGKRPELRRAFPLMLLPATATVYWNVKPYRVLHQKKQRSLGCACKTANGKLADQYASKDKTKEAFLWKSVCTAVRKNIKPFKPWPPLKPSDPLSPGKFWSRSIAQSSTVVKTTAP